ncbi:hypothetical protein BKA70DRAFT_1300949 [Coprinopsis sp. MPI-PUGE-AT-0042]|nr:hypothetical protein BKA70DRAFT_1300949 [Coprinopsis sp. MPI-PUGE-AT-0042]
MFAQRNMMAHASHIQAKVGLPRDDDEKNLVLEYAELVFTETFGFSFPLSTDSSFVPPGGATPSNPRTSEKEATIDNANQNQQSPTNGCSSRIAKVYTPSDLSTANPVKGDLIVAFFTDSAGAPHKTIELGFAAVYYDVPASLEWAKFQMRLNAYKAASTGLANGKQSYSKQEFARDFSYQWGQNPPDFVDDGQYTMAQSVALAYFEDGKTDKMESFVRNKILEGASVPAWAEANVVKALVDTTTTKLSIEPNTRSWSVNKYDKTYDDPKGNDGSFRVNGVFISYTSSQIAYVFWLGESYTKPALKAIVYSDMISELFNNLHSAMSQVPTSGLKADKQGLLELLDRCGKAQFKFYTSYEFKGNSTKPPRSNGDEVYAVACFGEIDDPVTDGAVADWTTKNIFEPTTTTRDNNWGNNQFPQSYSHPTSSSKSLAGDSVTFYANGAKSERGLTVKSNMIFFVGVYYVADITSDGSDSEGV